MPTVTMVGGGQLARMTHQAAIALGQRLRVLAEHPDDPFVLFNLGSIAVERADWEAAHGLLRRSLAGSGPTDSITRKLSALVARCRQMTGDLPGAAAVCDEGLAVAPDDARLFILPGGTLWEQPYPADALHAAPLLASEMLIAPVPLHRWRLFRRQYNQAALLSAGLARLTGLEHCPDLLARPRATGSQEGRSREARIAALDGAIRVTARYQNRLRGRPVLLVDDVMTSGATFAAATAACHAAGAGPVRVKHRPPPRHLEHRAFPPMPQRQAMTPGGR